MHVTIRLAPEVAPIIQRVATEKGKDVASFLEEFVQEAFTVPRQSRTLDEILAPFRAQVEASGMSDTELEAFFEVVRDKDCKSNRDTANAHGRAPTCCI